MKTKNTIALLTAFGIALAGLSARAQTEETAEPANVPPGPPHARFGEVLNQILQKYDANHDGQLDQSEMAALQKDIADGKVQPPGPPPGRGPRGPGGPPAHFPKEILAKYDLNKDGQLDESERSALHQDIQEGKIQPPRFGAGPRGPRGPWFGERPTAEQILNRFDADKDGKLDASELSAFLNAAPPRLQHAPGVPPPPASEGQ